MRNLRISSNRNNATPKPNAGQTYFIGTGRVLNIELNHGIRVMSRPTELEKTIPMRMVQLRAFPKNGLCWKNETCRVRVESRLNICITHNAT
jgi:hypothetical protein